VNFDEDWMVAGIFFLLFSFYITSACISISIFFLLINASFYDGFVIYVGLHLARIGHLYLFQWDPLFFSFFLFSFIRCGQFYLLTGVHILGLILWGGWEDNTDKYHNLLSCTMYR